MDLTSEEAKIIEEKRQKEASRKKANLDRLQLFQTLYEWEKWLQENGAGATFSTFCDDFGYGGDNRASVYKLIEDLRTHARVTLMGIELNE